MQDTDFDVNTVDFMGNTPLEVRFRLKTLSSELFGFQVVLFERKAK